MKPFYQVASFHIDSPSREAEFVNDRKTWFDPSKVEPILYCITSHWIVKDVSYYAEVNVYRRNFQLCPSTEKVA